MNAIKVPNDAKPLMNAILKAIVRSFHQKNWKKFFFRDYNVSGIKLYIRVANLLKYEKKKKRKKRIETIKYWKS